jgi:flavin-dependent dehydrogenase
MQTTQSFDYDVVIMGAGFAGLCQARHLQLKIPNIKIAIVDPRPENRQVKDMKIGESMVEIAALFLGKELGLYEYLIENHTPKIGLNFHWPKDKTKTESLDDYYHIWSNRQTSVVSFHFNRAKLETDLLVMVKEKGATFYNGRVVDIDLPEGDILNTAYVKIGEDYIKLNGQHLVDAAGTNFIINRKKDNLITETEQLFGHNTGTAWVRVKNIDRTVFNNYYNPERATSSCYYATNHYFGTGHWLWMIPSEKDSMELSIGVIHHHDLIPSHKINTKEKFYNFLKANHTILSKVIESGEDVDFHYRPRVPYKSKEILSSDNWYLVGDSAYIFDAFYSYGTSTIALAIDGITEVIRAKLAGEADAEVKRNAYNNFNLAYQVNVNHLMRYHNQQLGNASVMSWRIYFEYMFWFGIHVPMYISKWHLHLKFVERFTTLMLANTEGLFHDIYQQMNQLVAEGKNIGLMDAYRADQLIGDFSPVNHFDHFIENAQLEPLRINIFSHIKHTYLHVILWYLKFQWKGFGIKGVLNPKHLYHVFRLLILAFQASIGERVYKSKTKGLPTNSYIAQMREEFKTYRYQPANN